MVFCPKEPIVARLVTVREEPLFKFPDNFLVAVPLNPPIYKLPSAPISIAPGQPLFAINEVPTPVAISKEKTCPQLELARTLELSGEKVTP